MTFLCPVRVNRVTLTVRRSLPVYLDKQTCSEPAGASHLGQERTSTSDEGRRVVSKAGGNWARRTSMATPDTLRGPIPDVSPIIVAAVQRESCVRQCEQWHKEAWDCGFSREVPPCARAPLARRDRPVGGMAIRVPIVSR